MKNIKIYGHDYFYKKINIDVLKIKSIILKNFFKSILNSALIHININQRTIYYDDNRVFLAKEKFEPNNTSILWILIIDSKEDLDRAILLNSDINKNKNFKIFIKINKLYLKKIEFKKFILSIKKMCKIWSFDHIDNIFINKCNNDHFYDESIEDYCYLYCVEKDYGVSVLFFSPSPNLGGTEKMLLELVQYLLFNYGVICTVITPGTGELNKKLSIIGVPTIASFKALKIYGWWCEDFNTNNSDNDRAWQMFSAAKLINTNVLPKIIKYHPDVVWTQSLVMPWGSYVACKINKPHVWFITEYGELDFKFKFYSNFEDIIKEVFISSNKIYTCSKSLIKNLFKSYSDLSKIRHLYTEIPQLEISQIIPNYISPDKIKIGMFSQIREEKGQYKLIKALRKIKSENLMVQIIIVGGGSQSYINDLIHLANQLDVSDLIKFTGYVTSPQDIMNLCDIVVMGSKYEAFGRVGVEAMSLGIPVIFPKISGVSEYQVDEVTGFSYDDEDIESLENKLILLIKNNKLRNKMGQAAKKHIQKFFEEEIYPLSVYNELRKISKIGRGDISINIINKYLKNKQ